jgi:D-glycero-D-manno-heptose 1,7-bisphosphate phosphatase
LKNRALFLDLDGIILETGMKDGKIISAQKVSEAVLIEGVREALSESKTRGFLNIVITNQPEISRGRYKVRDLRKLNKWLLNQLPVDAIYVCPHDDDDICQCRKPKPGLIEAAVLDFNVDRKLSYMVGDRWKDVEAAQNADISAFFIPSFENEKSPRPPFQIMDSLTSILNAI